MWILAALLLIVLTGLAVFWPYLRPQPQAIGAETDPRLAELYSRRDMLYQAIRDARFDMEMGKLSAEDYEQQSSQLKQQAADVLRAIDAVEGEIMSPALAAKVEAEVAAARLAAAKAAVGGNGSDEALEATIATARRARPATPVVASRFCTQCGSPLTEGDRFCGKCGKVVVGARA